LPGAYSPLEQRTVISVQTQNPTTGALATELWIIDLTGSSPPQQLTHSPDLLKTDAFWSSDNREIYFIGSAFDAQLGALRGGIYSIPVDGSAPATLRFQSTMFSPSAILWVYG
jgi:hypothetical protein